MKKFFSVMLLATALIFIGGQTNQAEAAIQVTGISTYLSVRASPSVYSREIGRVPNGYIFYEVGDDQRAAVAGFFCVRYNGVWAYVSDKYVRYVR